MSSGKTPSEVEKKEAVDAHPQAATNTKKRTATIACAGCAIVFVIAAIAGIIAATVWDNKDSRLYQGKPLPENVGYIGRWVSDGTVAARIDTFVLAGDRQPATLRSAMIRSRTSRFRPSGAPWSASWAATG